MTYTQRRLKLFRAVIKKSGWDIPLDGFGSRSKAEFLSAIEVFLSTSLNQALAEERERVRGVIERINTPLFTGASGLGYNNGFNDGEKSGQFRLKEEIIDILAPLDITKKDI